jgi:uncharacterized protein YcbK (DUF882 family)
VNRPRSGRRPTASRLAQRAALGAAILISAVVAGVRGTQDAVANGDTRTLTILHMHTQESATITFRRDGRYDSQALEQLNWLLRDWRIDQPIKMDPRLFDIVWQVYREVGSREPIHVASAYRSPGTNAMLRRHSRAVSEFSQHMAGKAMDFYLPDVSVDRIRAIGMRAQHGGVGYYPNARNPFVHLDTGSVRAWPRMTRDQLVRLFPTGKTVHIPADGQPLPGYEEAKAEVLARGGTVAGYTAYASAEESEYTGRRRSLWATLFGGDDEDTEYYRAPAQRRGAAAVAAYAPSNSEDGGARGFFALFRPAQPPQQPEAPQAQPPTSGADSAEAQSPPPAPAPLPPRRPSDLALFADAPLPPARPVAVAGIGVVPLPGPILDPDSDRSEPSKQASGVAAHPAPPARGVLSPAAAKGADPVSETASVSQSGAKPNADDKAALRALFAAAATTSSPASRAKVATSRTKPQPVAAGELLADMGPTLNLRLASNPTNDLSASRFTGPAVKPLPVLR